MPQTITVPNFPEKNILEVTAMGADSLVGATSIKVQNTESITNGSRLILGALGSENSEAVTVNGIPTNATDVTISAATLKHYTYDDVTVVFANKLVFYRAPAPSDGSIPADSAFAAIATININVDQLSTTYTDPTGGAAFWYKLTYKDSISNSETTLASSSAVRGGAVNDYVSVEAIRKEAGFDGNRNVTDDEIDQKRQAAQSEVNSRLAGRYSVPFTAPINPFIIDITLRLAAGLVRLKQFGDYGTAADNPNKAKVQQARDDLKELQEGTSSLVGPGAPDSGSGGSDSGSSSGGFNGLPNDTTTPKAMFSVKDVSGFGRY